MLSRKFDEQNGKLHSLRKAILGVSKADMEAAEQIVKDSLYENEEGYTCKRVLVPERCRMEALKKSLRTLEDPQNASLPKLLSIDEDAHGQRYLTEDKQNLEVPQSLYSLIQKPSGKNEPSFVPENVSSRQLMASLVEIGTYYYSMSCYDAMAKDIGAEEYKPAKTRFRGKKWNKVQSVQAILFLALAQQRPDCMMQVVRAKRRAARSQRNKEKRVKCCATIISSLVRCRNFRSALWV